MDDDEHKSNKPLSQGDQEHIAEYLEMLKDVEVGQENDVISLTNLGDKPGDYHLSKTFERVKERRGSMSPLKV